MRPYLSRSINARSFACARTCLWCLLAVTFVWTTALGQQDRTDGSAAAGKAGTSGQPSKLASGSRRIVFVAENDARMPEAARRIELGAITTILSFARTQDSFALLTARGPLTEIRFGADREALRKGAEALANSPPDKAQGQGTLDALMEAITWLQPPKPGDAIFLFALDLKGRHHTRFTKVRKSAVRDRIRVFAFALDWDTAEPPDPLQSFTSRQIESGLLLYRPCPLFAFWSMRLRAPWISRTPGMAGRTISSRRSA